MLVNGALDIKTNMPGKNDYYLRGGGGGGGGGYIPGQWIDYGYKNTHNVLLAIVQYQNLTWLI